MIVDRADESGLELLTPRSAERRGGLVRLRVPGGRNAAERVVHALFERDVVLDRRGDALRVSPHFFNAGGDIDRCFAELDTLL
jgi:kynureninase